MRRQITWCLPSITAVPYSNVARAPRPSQVISHMPAWPVSTSRRNTNNRVDGSSGEGCDSTNSQPAASLSFRSRLIADSRSWPLWTFASPKDSTSYLNRAIRHSYHRGRCINRDLRPCWVMTETVKLPPTGWRGNGPGPNEECPIGVGRGVAARRLQRPHRHRYAYGLGGNDFRHDTLWDPPGEQG